MIRMMFLMGLLCASCALPGPELPGMVHILSIGISYEGTDAQRLRGTLNDAKELLAAFSQRYKTCTTQLLVEETATKEHVVQALSMMPDGELAIIIYSGHGTKTVARNPCWWSATAATAGTCFPPALRSPPPTTRNANSR